MTEPGFRIERIHEGIPFRSRAAFHGYLVFAGQDVAVLVEPGTARELRQAAERSWPDETGGLVTGRVLRDADGTYVAVSAFLEGSAWAGSPSGFSMSPQETAELRELASSRYPAADVVGWWHSHLGPSPYSDTDMDTQAMWTQQASVGLLVFAGGDPWGIAYFGPGAQRLSLISQRLQGQTAQLSRGEAFPHSRVDSAAAAGKPPGPWRPGPGPAGGIRFSRRSWHIATLALPLVTGVLVAAAVLAGFALFSRQLTADLRGLGGPAASGPHGLAGQLDRVPASGGSEPAVTWSCVRQAGTSYSCTAHLLRLSGAVVWLLDGSPGSYGLHADIPLRADGRQHILTVLVAGTAGSFSAGQQPLG